MDVGGVAINFDCLPDEILLHIFSYFQAEELSGILCNVCECWRCLAQDNTLWIALTYFCDSETDITCIRKVLSFAPALKVFAMHFRDDGGVLLKELCDSFESLQRLELRSCSLGSEDSALMLRIVTQYPNLSALSLESCQPLGTEALLHISSLRNLRKLNLSNCKRLTGETLRYIVDHCHHLTELKIDHVTELYDEDVTKVLEKLSSQLLVLTLDGKHITDKTYKQLQHCKRLTQLEISICDQMTDEGLLQGIAPLEDINFLRLKRGYVLSAAALSKFLNRPAMSCLLYLNLTQCSSLDDSGLQGIAEKCAKLQYLALRWCWEMTDKGLTSIVTHCSQLCVLDLLGAVQVTGVGYLNLIPSSMPYLKHLNLEQCDNVCDEEVNWLVKNMPKLVVIDYYGYQVTIEEEETKSEGD